jgi:hypothetical protein
MKTYIDFDKSINFENIWIPKDPSNRFYIQFLKELEDGEAELILPPGIIWDQIRIQRNTLLRNSDWIGVSDAQPKPSKQAWLDYRQALRDITKTYSKPEDVIWPIEPK